MNLEKENTGNSSSRKSSSATGEKKNKYSHTPQPSVKNINPDMTKIIENELSHIGDSKNKEMNNNVYFFGVYLFTLN